MDEELQQLEVELGRMRPVAPSSALKRRLAAELGGKRRRLVRVTWFWAAALPAAAALAFMVSQAPGLKPAVPTPPLSTASSVSSSEVMLKPVLAENILVAAQDEGLVTLDDGTTARRARLKYVDTITWKNPRTNASLIWTVPREEVRIVPVTFQ